MFETIADQGPAGVLAAMTEHLAKLPSQLWRTENDGFASIAAAIDALAVQVDCTRGRPRPRSAVPRGRVRVLLLDAGGLVDG
jgi:hypothetical protein